MSKWTKEVIKKTIDFTDDEKKELGQFILFTKIKGRLRVNDFGKVYVYI